MKIYIEFTKVECLYWFVSEGKKLADPTKYDPGQMMLDRPPLEEYIIQNGGPWGSLGVDIGGKPVYDISDDFEHPIHAYLPEWTLPLVKKYVELRKERGYYCQVHIYQAVKEMQEVYG